VLLQSKKIYHTSLDTVVIEIKCIAPIQGECNISSHVKCGLQQWLIGRVNPIFLYNGANFELFKNNLIRRRHCAFVAYFSTVFWSR